jgi:hypothetical protein
VCVLKNILPFSPFSVNALSKSSSDERGVSASDSLLFSLAVFGFVFCKSFDSADCLFAKRVVKSYCFYV